MIAILTKNEFKGLSESIKCRCYHFEKGSLVVLIPTENVDLKINLR